MSAYSLGSSSTAFFLSALGSSRGSCFRFSLVPRPAGILFSTTEAMMSSRMLGMLRPLLTICGRKTTNICFLYSDTGSMSQGFLYSGLRFNSRPQLVCTIVQFLQFKVSRERSFTQAIRVVYGKDILVLYPLIYSARAKHASFKLFSLHVHSKLYDIYIIFL